MKAQIFSVREILSFTTGLVLIISITPLFINFIYPRTAEFAIEENVKNLIAQIDTVLMTAYQTINQVNSGTLEYKISLPEKLESKAYSVNFVGDEICIRVVGGTGYLNCIQHNLGDIVSGDYISISDMLITATKQDSQILIQVGNA